MIILVLHFILFYYFCPSETFLIQIMSHQTKYSTAIVLHLKNRRLLNILSTGKELPSFPAVQYRPLPLKPSSTLYLGMGHHAVLGNMLGADILGIRA